MFNRKTEESEWTRFSKTSPGRDAGRDEAGETASKPAAAAAPAAGAPPATEAPIGPTPAPTPAPTPRPSDEAAATEPARAVPAPPPLPDRPDDESIIGERGTFEGNIRSDNSVRVRGTMQGDIESKRSIFIEETAKVSAKLNAEHIVVAGEVDGQIYCPGRVEFRPTGRMTGEIHAGTLKMDEGAFFEGHLKMVKPGAEPFAEAAATLTPPLRAR